RVRAALVACPQSSLFRCRIRKHECTDAAVLRDVPPDRCAYHWVVKFRVIFGPVSFVRGTMARGSDRPEASVRISLGWADVPRTVWCAESRGMSKLCPQTPPVGFSALASAPLARSSVLGQLSPAAQCCQHALPAHR